MVGCARRRRAPFGAQVAVRLGQSAAHLVRLGLRLAEVDDDIDIEINPADLRTDVYRSSGAGGQHVNKTSPRAHHPYAERHRGACQGERSQHKNRSTAMKMLKAKLYELEFNKRNAAAKVLEDSKSDVSWGNQIRSYVLDQSRIKICAPGGNRQHHGRARRRPR